MRQLPASASVISNNLYDVFGVLRHQQGSAQTPWRWKSRNQAEEGFSKYLVALTCSPNEA
jgi:hypothetical protein